MVLVRKTNRKSMKIVQKCELVKNKISERKTTFSKKKVAAGGLFYLDLKFECNRRRSDLSQRNIGTSRNWSKMSTSELILFEPQRIQSHLNIICLGKFAAESPSL